MNTPNPLALDSAEQDAIQYITELKKTDLMHFTPHEWRMLIQVIALSYRMKDIEVPF